MKFESFEQISKIKKDNNDHSENILIITTINENKKTKHAHYSAIKGFFLAKGLLKEGYTIFILSSEEYITLYNYYYYINYNLLSSKVLASFKCVFFCLHNKEIVTPLFERTDIFKNLVKAKSKNKKLLIINKTCQYPSPIDELKINSYQFFDYIYLQTEDICVPKYLVESLMKSNMFNLNNCSVSNFNSLCKNKMISSKIFSSEMTFDIDNLKDYKNPLIENKDVLYIRDDLYKNNEKCDIKSLILQCETKMNVSKMYSSEMTFDIDNIEYYKYPTVVNKNVLHLKDDLYKNNEKCDVKSFNLVCGSKMNISKLYSSEMTFDIDNIKDYKNTKCKIPFIVSKDTVNIIYLGRLMGSNGMDILYLIKLMKKLGKKYKLYIIPGSFVLPTLWPIKKKSASNKRYLELKNFFEKYELTWNNENLKRLNKYPQENYMPEKDDYNICNIEVLQQFEYGDHFQILKQMDIAIGFCETKHKKVPQGSSKLFDYMCCNLKIVFEDGWNNTKYIKEYNFGKCLSTNSTVSEAVDAIRELEKMPKEKIKYNAFVNDHNYRVRVKKIMNQIGLSGSNNFNLKNNIYRR